MSTSGIYYEWEKEQVSFFYPQLDLGKLDFLKVVYNGQLVDDETVGSLEPEGSSLAKDTQDGDAANEG